MSVLVIAEIGSVHDGSFGNALHLIDTAAECGADAVKFQTHLAAAETIRNAPQPPYFRGEPRFDYFQRTGFSREQWCQLKARCDEKAVQFLSSPFSVEAVRLLEEIGVSQYKIASGEVTNIPMLDAIGRTGKPVLLSSGMSSWDELDVAVATFRRHHDRITVLQCTSEYPCPCDRVGLNIMFEMRQRYELEVGLSDHTLDNYASYAAVTLGARAIERHLTFSRRMYGSDAKHSLEPQQFRELTQGVRAIESMLRHAVNKDDVTRYRQMKEIFQKSVVSLAEIPAGTVLTRELLGIKKPGNGIPPSEIDSLVGRRARATITADRVLTWDDVEQVGRRVA